VHPGSEQRVRSSGEDGDAGARTGQSRVDPRVRGVRKRMSCRQAKAKAGGGSRSADSSRSRTRRRSSALVA
jgi:hypothetical protein